MLTMAPQSLLLLLTESKSTTSPDTDILDVIQKRIERLLAEAKI
jgi:hypothetical protein